MINPLYVPKVMTDEQYMDLMSPSDRAIGWLANLPNKFEPLAILK
jgi:hypothetical protein